MGRCTIKGKGSLAMIKQTSLSSKWKLENGEHKTKVRYEIKVIESYKRERTQY